jgi:hypothetical protein
MKLQFLLFSVLLLFNEYTVGQHITSYTLEENSIFTNQKDTNQIFLDKNFVYLDVPVYKWSMGNICSMISMLAGYYDRHGYPCIYNDCYNVGLAPLSDNQWYLDSLSSSKCHFFSSTCRINPISFVVANVLKQDTLFYPLYCAYNNGN